jgi:hypothetical protein
MARKPKLGLPLQTLRNAPDALEGRRLRGGVFEIDPAQTFVARMGTPENAPAQIVYIDMGTGERVEHTVGAGVSHSSRFLFPRVQFLHFLST